MSIKFSSLTQETGIHPPDSKVTPHPLETLEKELREELRQAELTRIGNQIDALYEVGEHAFADAFADALLLKYFM